MAGKVKLFDSICNFSSNRNANGFQSTSSDDALRFTSPSKAQHTETQHQIGRCFNKLRSLRPSDSPTLKTELNLLFDQLISENYTNITHDNIHPQVWFSFCNVFPNADNACAWQALSMLSIWTLESHINSKFMKYHHTWLLHLHLSRYTSLSLMLFSIGCVWAACARKPSGSSQPGAFSHQTVPVDPSASKPTAGV